MVVTPSTSIFWIQASIGVWPSWKSVDWSGLGFQSGHQVVGVEILNLSKRFGKMSNREAERSRGRRGGRRCHAGHRACGRGTGARGAVRFEKSSRSLGPEGAGVVVGHHTHCAQRLDPLDHLR